MIPLSTRGKALNIAHPIVGVFKRSSFDKNIAYVASAVDPLITTPHTACELFTKDIGPFSPGSSSPCVYDIPALDHLTDGDIISINESGMINTLFRTGSHHNAIFITDRCNSNCLMCSQPPKNVDDLDYFHRINSSLVKLIPKDTEILGITGGEPTILGSRLLDLLNLLYKELPNTGIHMLSNGRIFSQKKYAFDISEANENLIIGIPIYSDNYLDHDFIVQARNAFSQTIVGLHNLARFGVPVEIRIVLHKLTYKRLPQIANFIYKNLPFVTNIAFMGLEYIGYTSFNHDKLWIEPSQYMNELEEAILFLDDTGMNVTIYNLQLCLLRKTLWQYSVKSISDWKRDYLDECSKCQVLTNCGGIFSTSKILSKEIKAIAQV